jgi:nucleotide-binding universal stress UspA family protein
VDFSGLLGGDRTKPWLSRRGGQALAGTAARGAARARRVAPDPEVRVTTRTEGAAARCPVAVVTGPGQVHAGPAHPVLVGVDGSPEANAALEYAADLAVGCGAPLTVVTVRCCSATDAWVLAYGGADFEAEEDGEAAAAVNAEAVEEVREAHPGLEVRPRVVAGTPGEVLADLAGDHALVVVGSRGHGGFRGPLLGSLSHTVIHHASRPVIVVRPVPDREQAPVAGAAAPVTIVAGGG